MAQRFAIGCRAEAVAYLEHDVLGPRLVECTRLVVAASDRTITEILGSAGRHEVPLEHDTLRRGLDQATVGDAIAAFYVDGKDPTTLSNPSARLRLVSLWPAQVSAIFCRPVFTVFTVCRRRPAAWSVISRWR